MSLFNRHPQPSSPPTELGRHHILSSTSGLRISPLALGGGNIGQAWSQAWGAMSKPQAFTLLDAYFEAGGNFIDTANDYQNGESESWIGEWLAQNQIRDQVVIATKYTADCRLESAGPGKRGRTANSGGNHRRSLHTSVRDSLERLQTEYIDILYVHWWDYTTSIEEVVDSLHALVMQGRVMYLGISDAPAWVVSAANMYAREKGRTQFSIYSGRWNVLSRDFEREILPMVRSFGMALAPWGCLGSGRWQSRKGLEERQDPLRPLLGGQAEVDVRLCEVLERVAGEHGVESVTQIALAYVLTKARQFGIYNCFPIVGGRKVEQLHENIGALVIRLTEEQIQALEAVQEFDIGFPANFVGSDPNVTGEASGLTERPVIRLQSPDMQDI
ncbi:putative aryl-alcohol dehydrogenase AAD14 [Madurella mycetomatis]|uniref:Aryl-alcohol dehydrogenase AAD14 n=1 Tax=Madurella mycetomatis TaxID=100816 RepID=A0A175W9B0_9PEZI|nr:putative aryl-alcohol dehydrogenase AAD14 [Madurella mycetomatis]